MLSRGWIFIQPARIGDYPAEDGVRDLENSTIDAKFGRATIWAVQNGAALHFQDTSFNAYAQPDSEREVLQVHGGAAGANNQRPAERKQCISLLAEGAKG